mgnify:CR=1 FL=1
MKLAQDIIIAPVITEKSMAGIANKKYTFKVAKDANKIEIAEAVEKAVGSKIEKRKITFTALVTALGDYTAKVQLHKEVTATINIIIALK